MAWSTRQLAELAGTTVKAVRHYHQVGLLEEPERSANGYKRYGVPHLARLLRIRRLTDLGLSLSQIAELGEADERPDAATLHRLDAELADTIDRLRRVRAELAVLLRDRAPLDLPPEFADQLAELTEADRALLVVWSRVLPPEGIAAFRRMLADHRVDSADREFDTLPADASEARREELADRLLPGTLKTLERHPDVLTQQARPAGSRHPGPAVAQAIGELYNDAQRDVLRRLNRRLREHRERQPAG